LVTRLSFLLSSCQLDLLTILRRIVLSSTASFGYLYNRVMPENVHSGYAPLRHLARPFSASKNEETSFHHWKFRGTNSPLVL